MRIQNTVSQLNQLDVNSTELNLQSTVSNLAKQGLNTSALVLTNKAVDTQIKTLQKLKSEFESEGRAGSSKSLSRIKTQIHALKTLQDRAFRPTGNPELVIPISGQGLVGGGKRTLATTPSQVVEAARNSNRGRAIRETQNDAIDFIDNLSEDAAHEGPEQQVQTLLTIRSRVRGIKLLDDAMENHINRVSAALAAQVRGLDDSMENHINRVSAALAAQVRDRR